MAFDIDNKISQIKKDLERLEAELDSFNRANYDGSENSNIRKKQKQIKEKQLELLKYRNVKAMQQKDTMEILKLSGFTVDGDIILPQHKAKDDDATKEGAIKKYGKEKGSFEDGGPGSGIKGHTTPENDPDTKYANFMKGRKKPLSYSEGKKLLEEAKKAGIHQDYIKGMERGIAGLKDACEEKIFTKGTKNITGGLSTMNKDEKEQWITVNGAHVKIEGGESKESAVKNFINKKQDKKEVSNPKKGDDKARKKWAKTLAEEYELGSPKDIRKNMEEDDEVDEEYLENYTKQYNIILDHPVGSKVLIGGKEREITDYIPDDDGEDIMAELDGDDWVSVMSLKKSSSKDADPKVAEAEAMINLFGGVR